MARPTPKEVVVRADDPGTYPALSEGRALAVVEAIKENLDGEAVTAFDLDRAKIGAGGMPAFQVPTPEGVKVTEAIEGVIVLSRNVRAYWKGSIDDTGGGQPPDCQSPDAIIGHGDPGGECALCPLSEFGSSPKGDGQACRAMRQLFILRPDSLLPLAVVLPPTSLKSARQYLIQLAGAGVVYRHVVTRISLEPATAGGGQEFSRAKFSRVSDVAEADIPKIEAYAAAVKPLLEQQAIVDKPTARVGDPVASALADDDEEF